MEILNSLSYDQTCMFNLLLKKRSSKALEVTLPNANDFNLEENDFFDVLEEIRRESLCFFLFFFY